MEKKEYIESLKKFVTEKGISIHDYFYAYALAIRSSKKFELPTFELNNPFLTATDIKLLLDSREEGIEEYYANAMTRVIELNEELLKKQEVTALVVIDDKKEVSREEITDVVEEKLDETSTITRTDIEEVVNEELDKKDDTLSRTAVEEVVEEKLDETSTITRTDIEDVVGGELDKKEDTLSREAVEEVVEEKLDETSTITRTDIEDVINEKLNEIPTLKLVITTISRKIADLLNGFAVIKESKTGRAHMYYHDAKTDSLTGEKVILNNKLDADSGYYVNYQEYIDEMLDGIIEKSSNPEEIRFVRDDGQEKTVREVIEEAFEILRQNGAIRFGKDLLDKNIRTYQDLLDVNSSQKEEFAGKELTTGLYVRRDILQRIFARYKIKYNIYQLDNNKESHL